MACYHPVDVGIRRKPAFPGGPRTLDEQTVPCGKCLGCRAEQARQWAIRLTHESQVTTPAYFVTLTYAPEALPDYGDLAPAHTRNFLKRLRKARPSDSIRYYLCGEYGDQTERPHYHAVLLGTDFLDRTVIRGGASTPTWTSPTLESIWGHGLVEFSPVTWASASYVTGYVRKKMSKRDDPDHYLRVDQDTGELVELNQEFARMSRRPAIGLSWLKRYWSDVYPRDHVTVNGIKCKPPRYYDRAFEDPKHDFDGITFRERQELLYQVKLNRWNPDLEVTDDILENREKNHQARVQLFQQRDAI